MFCSLYNNMKRSCNIPRFHSKQTCMSMWRRPRGQTALGALCWTIFHICSRFEHKLPQYPETPLTRSGFETMFLRCIKSAIFDAQLHESPSNASMWKYTFGCWRQWQEPNPTRPAVFRGENTGSSPNSGWIPSLGLWLLVASPSEFARRVVKALNSRKILSELPAEEARCLRINRLILSLGDLWPCQAT